MYACYEMLQFALSSEKSFQSYDQLTAFYQSFLCCELLQQKLGCKLTQQCYSSFLRQSTVNTENPINTNKLSVYCCYPACELLKQELGCKLALQCFFRQSTVKTENSLQHRKFECLLQFSCLWTAQAGAGLQACSAALLLPYQTVSGNSQNLVLTWLYYFCCRCDCEDHTKKRL